MELFKNFWKEEEGQDFVEYAFLIGFIALAMVAVLRAFEGSLSTIYSNIGGTLESAPIGS